VTSYFQSRSQVIGAFATGREFEADEGVRQVDLVMAHYFNFFYFPADEEVRVNLVFSNTLRQVSYPDFTYFKVTRLCFRNLVRLTA